MHQILFYNVTFVGKIFIFMMKKGFIFMKKKGHAFIEIFLLGWKNPIIIFD